MIRFPGRSPHVLDHGIGVNWHHNWVASDAPRDSSPDIDDAERWELLLDELTFLRVACIRFGYQATRFVDDAGRIDWDAEGFTALRRLDEWAAENGASIVFDPWLIPHYYSFGVGEDGIFYDAPRDLPAFVAGFVMPVLDHIVNKMVLRTVGHFILMNEPLLGGSGTLLTPPGIDRIAYYVECYKLIHDAIEEAGLPIKIIGPDTYSLTDWAVNLMHDRDLDITPYVDALDHHMYYTRFDYLPPNLVPGHSTPMSNAIADHVLPNGRYARAHGKPYYITELGTFYYGWRNGDPFGAATHEAFLTEAEFIIRSIEVGCGGFYRWAFLAPGEYGDGVWQFINTVDGSYTRQPHTFYGYGTLMRYSAPGALVWSSVIDEEIDNVCYVQSVGLELPGDEYTIFVVNDNNAQERVVRIEPPDGWTGDWQKVLDDRTRKMVRCDIEPVDGAIHDCLPPMSLTAYTTRRLQDDHLLAENPNRFTKA